MKVRPVVLVHGGAGPMKRLQAAEEVRYRAGLVAASRAGLAVLEKGGSALDAVVAAILSMEDSGEFNAGAGACLDEEGRATLDAALMRGADLGAGAVGAAQATRNPILVARNLLEEGRHVLLVGEGADRRARALGLAPLAPIDDARKKIWRACSPSGRGRGRSPTTGSRRRAARRSASLRSACARTRTTPSALPRSTPRVAAPPPSRPAVSGSRRPSASATRRSRAAASTPPTLSAAPPSRPGSASGS